MNNNFIAPAKKSINLAKQVANSIEITTNGPFVDFKEDYSSSNSVDREFLQKLQDHQDTKEYKQSHMYG